MPVIYNTPPPYQKHQVRKSLIAMSMIDARTTGGAPAIEQRPPKARKLALPAGGSRALSIGAAGQRAAGVDGGAGVRQGLQPASRQLRLAGGPTGIRHRRYDFDRLHSRVELVESFQEV